MSEALNIDPPVDPLAERFKLLADIVQELARIAGVEPGESLYTTLERLREVHNNEGASDAA